MLFIFTCSSQDLKANKYSSTQGLRQKLTQTQRVDGRGHQSSGALVCGACVFAWNVCVRVRVHGRSALEGPVVRVNPLKDCGSLEISVDFSSSLENGGSLTSYSNRSDCGVKPEEAGETIRDCAFVFSSLAADGGGDLRTLDRSKRAGSSIARRTPEDLSLSLCSWHGL